ncbi:MAG: SPOR domain-containing protein, partial [Gammaproteobacteria bacterium]
AAAARGAGDPAADAAEADPQFDFYDRLKNQQVVIPEQEKDARPELPTSLIDRPGVYVLQPGAYRDAAEAEKLRARLARLGVQATIQRVAIDADVFHRVRIGPYEDLGELNAVRAKLRAADIDPQVMRVGD